MPAFETTLTSPFYVISPAYTSDVKRVSTFFIFFVAKNDTA